MGEMREMGEHFYFVLLPLSHFHGCKKPTLIRSGGSKGSIFYLIHLILLIPLIFLTARG
jgi:hypothetical protein